MELNKEYGTCLRCGRKLKSEESKKLGFGKICWEKWQSSKNANGLFSVEGLTQNSDNE
jgi:hypothetical protein